MRGLVFPALPSHGRSHRFDPCHAHQGNEVTEAPSRAQLPPPAEYRSPHLEARSGPPWGMPNTSESGATARAYALIVDGELTHDGTPALARHIAKAILKADSRGARLAKEHKDSPRRIDAGSMVMAVYRAAELADTTPAIYA